MTEKKWGGNLFPSTVSEGLESGTIRERSMEEKLKA